MDRGGELGAADELPLGCAQIDEDEVTGGKRVAVRLVRVDAPQPDPQEPSGLFAQRRPLHCVPLHEIEKVMRHLRSVPWPLLNLACAPEEGIAAWASVPE